MHNTNHASAQRIAEVARAIRDIHRIAELERVVETGRLVVDNLYEGDLTRLRNRGTSDVALRILAFHPELPSSAAELYETIAGFEAIEALGGLEACRHIGLGHVREVVPLPPHRQHALLSRAERRCWSVRELAHAVQQERAVRRYPPSLPQASCTPRCAA